MIVLISVTHNLQEFAKIKCDIMFIIKTRIKFSNWKIGICRYYRISWSLRVISNIGGFAKRAHPARARYLNVNLARRNRDLQPGGKEIEGGGRGGGGGGEK